MTNPLAMTLHQPTPAEMRTKAARHDWMEQWPHEMEFAKNRKRSDPTGFKQPASKKPTLTIMEDAFNAALPKKKK